MADGAVSGPVTHRAGEPHTLAETFAVEIDLAEIDGLAKQRASAWKATVRLNAFGSAGVPAVTSLTERPWWAHTDGAQLKKAKAAASC